jgi:hypothetical protein
VDLICSHERGARGVELVQDVLVVTDHFAMIEGSRRSDVRQTKREGVAKKREP